VHERGEDGRTLLLQRLHRLQVILVQRRQLSESPRVCAGIGVENGVQDGGLGGVA
jgi:hypothetical protein